MKFAIFGNKKLLSESGGQALGKVIGKFKGMKTWGTIPIQSYIMPVLPQY